MKETDDALRRIVKGTGIVAIGLVISKILSYAYRLIIARIGVEQYGLFSIAFAVFSILVTISLLGMGEGVIRFVSFYKSKADQKKIKGIITSSLKMSVPISIILGLCLFIFSDWVAVTFFHNIELSILFKIFAFIIPLDIIRNIFTGVIKAFQKVEYEVYAKSIGENIVKVVFTSIALYLGFKIVGVAVSYLLAVFFSVILSFYFLEKKVFPIVKTKISSIKLYKTLLVFSLPLLFTGFILLVIQWIDTLMLGYFKTVLEVGFYNVAMPTASLLLLFPLAMRTLFFPILTELYAQGKKEAIKEVYRTVVKWNITIGSIVFIFLVIFSKQIVSILFGESYVTNQVLFMGYSFSITALALIILSSTFLMSAFVGVVSMDILLMLKKTKTIFFATSIAAGSNILFNYILIPPYGVVGAAIATAFSLFIRTLIVFVAAYISSKINPFRLNCIKVWITAFIILVSMIFLKVYLITNIFYLIIIVLTFLIIYLGLLILTKSFEKEDFMILNSILQKLKIKH